MKLSTEDQVTFCLEKFELVRIGNDIDMGTVPWDKLIEIEHRSEINDKGETVYRTADIRDTPISDLYTQDGQGIAYLIGTKLAAFHYGREYPENRLRMLGVDAEIKDYKISYEDFTSYKDLALGQLKDCIRLSKIPHVVEVMLWKIIGSAKDFTDKEIFEELSEWEEGYKRTGDVNFLTKRALKGREESNS